MAARLLTVTYQRKCEGHNWELQYFCCCCLFPCESLATLSVSELPCTDTVSTVPSQSEARVAQGCGVQVMSSHLQTCNVHDVVLGLLCSKLGSADFSETEMCKLLIVHVMSYRHVLPAQPPMTAACVAKAVPASVSSQGGGTSDVLGLRSCVCASSAPLTHKTFLCSSYREPACCCSQVL